MTRKKLNNKRMDFYISQTNFEKLKLLCNDEKTYTIVINEAIEGRYYKFFKTNEIITQELKEKIDIANIDWLGDNNEF